MNVKINLLCCGQAWSAVMLKDLIAWHPSQQIFLPSLEGMSKTVTWILYDESVIRSQHFPLIPESAEKLLSPKSCEPLNLMPDIQGKYEWARKCICKCHMTGSQSCWRTCVYFWVSLPVRLAIELNANTVADISSYAEIYGPLKYRPTN